MLKISIITIGNEILLGKTINTNLAYLGEELTKIGFQVCESSTIQDEADSIKSKLTDYWEISDIIIATGGLGPTKDDITKKCIAEFFQKKIIFNREVWAGIKTFYRKNNREIPEIVKIQAKVPEDFNMISNKLGTAPGLHYESQNKLFFALPGVPLEMKAMFQSYIKPLLQKKYQSKDFQQKTIRTIGVREANLAEKLADLSEDLNRSSDINIAFLPKPGMVDIRIYGSDKDEFKHVFKKLEERIKDYIYGYDNDTISELCHNKLLKRKKTLSIAESCTGGLVQDLLTNNAGSSEYFKGGIISYSNEAKNKILNVSKETLIKFGAVSQQTVKEMLIGVRDIFKSDFSIAVSGIAGPGGGTKKKPVGLVYIGVNIEDKIITKKFNFSGSRIQIKKLSAINAIYLLLKNL